MLKFIPTFSLLLISIGLFAKHPATRILLQDTTFSFENKENLVVLTSNPDSVEHYKKSHMYPLPFAPTMESSSAIIILRDTSFATVIIKDLAEQKQLVSFRWNLLNPGVYKFRWWEYYKPEKSGIYLVAVITKNDSTVSKALWK